jgi:ABC-2 type transport system permease protein
MGARAAAILWAQYRTLWNRFPLSNKLSLIFSAVVGVAWYAGFAFLGVLAAIVMSNPNELPTIAKILPGGLLLAFLYWQVVPLLLVSTGSALDIKRLVAYPIPKSEMFSLEVLLRLSTGIEIVFLMLGAGVGLLLNPRIPKWAPLALVVYVLFNLFVSAGVRDLLVRLFARRGVREVLVFGLVLCAALPQMLIATGSGEKLQKLIPFTANVLWPWIATAGLAQGRITWVNFGAMIGWTLAAYAFGRSQFERGLRFDAAESLAPKGGSSRVSDWAETLYRLPGRLLADPLGALVEKELRVLSRSARFRLVFLMGFSFGLIIWLPITFGKSGANESWMAHNYLAMVSVYALVLLSDVLFWNVFGFDRSAAQIYFLTPVKLKTVLLAKNITAMLALLIEVTIIGLVCAALRFPVDPVKLLEAYAVAATVAVYLMAAGNISSAYNPKPVDPSKSFRSSAGRQTQAFLTLLLPVGLIPIFLAYGARYAFRSNAAFFGVLLVEFLIGVAAFRIACDSAVAAAESRKENMIAVLGGGEGLISS